MKLKLMIVIPVIYFVVGVMIIYLFPFDIMIPDIYISPDTYFIGGPIKPILIVLWLIGSIFVDGYIPISCWEHPKSHVKLYAKFVFYWEIVVVLSYMVFIWFVLYEIIFILILFVGTTVPLVPLWYLLYKHKFPKEWKRKKHT